MGTSWTTPLFSRHSRLWRRRWIGFSSNTRSSTAAQAVNFKVSRFCQRRDSARPTAGVRSAILRGRLSFRHALRFVFKSRKFPTSKANCTCRCKATRRSAGLAVPLQWLARDAEKGERADEWTRRPIRAAPGTGPGCWLVQRLRAALGFGVLRRVEHRTGAGSWTAGRARVVRAAAAVLRTIRELFSVY